MRTTHGAYYSTGSRITPDSHAIPTEAPSTMSSNGPRTNWLQWAMATVQSSFLKSADWDQRGAEAPTSIAATSAMKILQKMASTHGVPQPSIVSPRPDGGFVIEWGPGYFDLTIEIEPEDRPASYWYQDPSGSYQEGSFNLG